MATETTMTMEEMELAMAMQRWDSRKVKTTTTLSGKVVKTMVVPTTEAHYNKSIKEYDRQKSLGYKLKYKPATKTQVEHIVAQVSNCYVTILQDPEKEDGFKFAQRSASRKMCDNGTTQFYNILDKAKYQAIRSYLLDSCWFKKKTWSELKKASLCEGLEELED